MQPIIEGRQADGRARVERRAEPPSFADALGAPAAAADVSLLRVINIALRYRGLVLLTTALVTGAVTVATLAKPNTYTATAQFVPQTRRGGSNLSGLAAQFGVAVPGADAGESGQFYIDLIGSRDVLGEVASGVYDGGGVEGRPRGRAPLATWLDVQTSDARVREAVVEAKLGGMIVARLAAASGIVALRVRAPDPSVAQQIAARLLSALDEFNRARRQTQASAEREFTGRRLAEARTELRDAESRLQQFLAGNRGFSDASALRVELDRLTRDVSLRQQLFTTIAQSYEQARIDEVRDTPVLTVIERPVVPIGPDPRFLSLKVALGVVLGLLLGMLAAVVRDYLARGGDDPADARAEFAALRRQAFGDLRHPLRAVVRGGTRGAVARRESA